MIESQNTIDSTATEHHTSAEVAQTVSPTAAVNQDTSSQFSGPKVYGVDVSSYQPTVNWSQMASMGKKFAFCKSSEGVTHLDNAFFRHRTGAKNSGLTFGAYHFFRPLLDPVQQADTFLRAAGNVMHGELPLTLDIEWSDGIEELGEKYAERALAMLEKLEDATGLAPIIYTSAPFFTGFPHPERFAKYTNWLAAYSHLPVVPAPWTSWKFWQYSETLTVAGSDKIDGNVFNGDLAALLSLTKK